MDEFDFAEFVEAAEATTGLELTSWQREALSRFFDGKPVRLLDPNAALMRERAYRRDLWAAAAIASGQPVQFVALDSERSENARQRALALLDRMDRVSEDNNQ